MKCLGLTRQGVPCRNEGPFCRIHRPASVGEALQLIARRLWWEVRRHWLYIALVVIAGAEATLWISWWLGFWGPDELGWLQGVVMAFWGPLLVAALWAWKYQGWRQRLGAWLAARRCLIIATLTLWAWLQSCYWPMRLFDSRLAPLLKQPRVFWPIILWPVAIWLAWGLRAALLWPLGFRRRQAPRPAPDWWPAGRPWPPRWLPSVVLWWEWSATRPYWLIIAGGTTYCFLNWGLIFAALVLWAGVFLYVSAQRPQPLLKDGHTIYSEARPHPLVFPQALLRYGLLPVFPKGARLTFLHYLTLVLRYFTTAGPIVFVMATAITTTLGLHLWKNPWWWIGFGGGVSLYWIIFAFFGWRKILYVSTNGPHGAQDGEVLVSVPRLRPWGVVTRWARCQRRVLVTATEDRLIGSIVNLDPGGELTLAREEIDLLGVDTRVFRW